MAKIVYFTVTGQTKKFVQKIPHVERIEIKPQNPFLEVNEPFILVVPTYVAAMVEPVYDFLETGDNVKYCAGLFGGGNRNFGGLFCFTVRDLAKEYQIPVLHDFEFQGSEYDVEKMEEELAQIESSNTKEESNRNLF